MTSKATTTPRAIHAELATPTPTIPSGPRLNPQVPDDPGGPGTRVAIPNQRRPGAAGLRTVVRWFIVVVTMGHGLIHLLGAAKGLGWAEVASLPEPIGQAMGLAWLGAAVAVVATAVLLAVRNRGWWVAGIVGVVTSQAVILTSWNDAQAGTAANVVLYATHGFSARTTTALVGTLFGLILAAGFGWGATKWAHLTGVASEDDVLLSAAAPNLTLISVVICGVIIAGLGVLNDVTITQASAVWELAGDGRQTPRQLFTKAMRIGRDHIASSVYTILFATAGAIMSVLLLLTVYQRPLFSMLLREQFAGEVVRSLVGSIALVLSVPVTTAIAVMVVAPREKAIDRLGDRTVDFADDELLDIDEDGR